MKKKLIITVLLAVTIMTTSCVQKMGKTIAQNIMSGEEIQEFTEQEMEEPELSKDKLFGQFASGLKEEILSSETETDLVKSEISSEGDQYQETVEFSSEEDNTESEIEGVDSTKITLDDLDLRAISSYNEYGLAKIQYYVPKEGIYTAFINKNGEVVFQSEKFSDSLNDGYIQCIVGITDYYTINNEGEITFRYSLVGKTNEALYQNPSINERYFGGYTFIRKNISDFDSIGYRYTIYDPYGAVVEEFETETLIPYNGIVYCHSGVFNFRDKGYFCTYNKKWVDHADADYVPRSPTFAGLSDEVLIGINYNDVGDRHLKEIEIFTMTPDGNQYSYHTGCLASEDVDVSLNDNICVITDEKNSTVFSFDLADGDLYELDEKHKEKLKSNGCTGEGYIYSEGRIIICEIGADGVKYLSAFDKKFNLIWGPVKATRLRYHKYIDGLCIMTTIDDEGKAHTIALDTDGNLILDFNLLGYSYAESYFSNGAVLVKDDNGNHYYLNMSGNQLFETIDFSNTKTLFAD